MSNENMTALTLAYKCVTKKLGWNHSRIRREYGITYRTLRRVRSGIKGKSITDNYIMSVFLTIINDAFRKDLRNNGGENSSYFNNVFREILLADYDISQV